MGQALVTPKISNDLIDFVNLPKQAVESLWMSYNLLGEGWGLNLSEIISVFNGASFVVENFAFTEKQLTNLFKAFDSDSNGLVDALELFITMALLSGMDSVEKLYFAFNTYDFDCSASLSFDEVMLLLRSMVKGLGKVAPSSVVFTSPSTDDIEQYVVLIFNFAGAARFGGRVQTEEFREYCTSHPVLSSWLKVVASFPVNDSMSLDARDKQTLLRNSFPQQFVNRARRPIEMANHAGEGDFIVPTVPLAQLEERDADVLEVVSQETLIESSTASLWSDKVDLLRPDETAAGLRCDAPEDVFESAWVGGINTVREGGAILRCAKYSFDGCGVVFSAGNHLITMTKGEESGWEQRVNSQHSHAIHCFDSNRHRELLVTAAGGEGDAEIIFWRSEHCHTAMGSLNVALGVKLLDISHNGLLLLVLFVDGALTVYDIADYLCVQSVFSTHLLASSAPTVIVHDVRFSLTSSMFAVADLLGMRFFVEEGDSFMGKGAMCKYEERSGLYHTGVKAARDVAVTVLTNFERPEDMVAGTAQGQVLVWHGRTCAQLVAAHRSAVSALDFHRDSLTLVSAAIDGSVCIFKLDGGPASAAGSKKGPKVVLSRTLCLDASFDILSNDLFCFEIRSVSLSADGNRLLVATAGNELLEVSARLAVPTAEELEASNEGVGEPEEGGVPAVKGKLGDDIHGGAIISGHFGANDLNPTISAVCRIPAGGFASCGTDQTVRLWINSVPEGASHIVIKPAKSTKMDAACRTIDASASALAVSLTGGSRAGSVHLFALPDLVFLCEFKDAAQTLHALKFSPDGSSLSAASSDGNIYVYTPTDSVWSLKGAIRGVVGDAPASLDYSSDSQCIRTIYRPSGAFKVWDVAGSFGKEVSDIQPPPPPTYDAEGELVPAEPVPGLEVLKALTWASHSCPYNWDSKGALALNLNSSLVNSFDRFNHLLVSACVNGSVIVDRVPALKLVASSGQVADSDLNQFGAHMGPVSCVCFIEEGTRLVTAGGADGVLRVWQVNYDLDEPEPDIEDPVDEENDGAAAVEEEEDDGKPKLEVLYDSGEDEDLLDGRFRLKEHLSRLVTTAEPTSAVDIWSGALGLNTETAAKDAAMALAAAPSLVPTDELELSWVYGCSTRGTRGAVRYSAEGTIIYPAGTMGIVFDKLAHKQRHVMAHCDDITALDVHVASGLAVSAHKGAGDISAALWTTKTGVIRRVLNCGPVGGVSAVRFSGDGKFVVAACQDDVHSILVFGVENGKLVTKIRGGLRKILDLTFSLGVAAGASSLRLLQSGVAHFKILTFTPSRAAITSKTGAYGAGLKKINVLCATALPMQTINGESPGGNEFALGMADGSLGLVVRGESKVNSFNPVLKGPVTAIAVVRVSDGSADEAPVYKMVVGGVNGWVKVLDMECQPLAEYNLYLKDFGLHSLGRVRGFKSFCVDKLGRKLLYGTAGGEVAEIDIDTGADVNSGPLVSGHFRDQLHALCTHPLRQECLTAGDDQTLRIWHLDSRKQATMIELPDIARAATYAPNGHIIAVGLGGAIKGEGRKQPRPLNGRVLIVSYLQGVLRIVHTANNAADTITSVLFSPDGSKLFAASLDGSIYLYDALDNFALVATMTAHSEGVAHIDVSDDGKYLVSHGTTSELLVWDLSTGTQVGNENERFEVLSTVGCNFSVRQGTFGLNSVGIFPPHSLASDVLALDQSKDAKLLATGDCFGAVKLFRNPAAEYFAPYKLYFAHSAGGVSKVAFTVDDVNFVSVGRHDRMLAQWRVTKSADLPDPHPFIPETLPSSDLSVEEDFSSSFVVKGVDFAQSGSAIPPSAAELKVFAKSIIGVGACSQPSAAATTEGASLRKSLFCGQGEILTAYGRTLTVLQPDANSQSPLLIERPLLVPAFDEVTNAQISCFDVSNSGRHALVGHHCQGGNSRNRLLLISMPSGQLISELLEHVLGGVIAVAFSLNGNTAACVAGDAQHCLHLFKTFSGAWDDATLIHSGQVSAAHINHLTFLTPHVNNLGEAAFDLVTAGEGHIKFWRVLGLNMSSECGNYDDGLSKPIITALDGIRSGDDKGQLITGDIQGSVHLWRGSKRERLLSTHSGPVTAVRSFSSGFVTASNDHVSIWKTSEDAVLLQTITVASILSGMGWTAPIYLNEKQVLRNFVTSISSDPQCSRLLLTFSSAVVVTVATDSRQVQRVSEGHGEKVLSVLSRPTDIHTVVTLSEDNVVRLWDISRATVQGSASLNVSSGQSQLAGFLILEHNVTCAVFVNSTTLLVGTAGGDSNGTSGSVVVVDVSVNKVSQDGNKFNLVISNKIHNVGSGAVHQIRVSPNNKQIIACSADGCAYMYDIPAYITGAPVPDDDDEVDPRAFTSTGFLLAHPGGAPVMGADFSADNRFARTFGRNMAHLDGRVEVNFFDFESTAALTTQERAIGNAVRKQAAGKVQDSKIIEELKEVQWASTSGTAAPELRGVNYSVDGQLLSVESLSVNQGNSLVATGYIDGSVGIFRFPVHSPATHTDCKSRINLYLHSHGKVLVTFSGAPTIGTQQLVSVGEKDGAMVVWHLQA